MNNPQDENAEIRGSKQENTDKNDERLSKALGRAAAAAASSSSGITTTSRQWAGFKNPRIVRVSRTFGGKDRHSKVCTIRGLRDRRIRLSVPTAIHLYDLQDRLGLTQPSKVIDWLLEATKLDIDKLPPLQIPPGSFNQQPFFGQLAGPSLHSGPHPYNLDEGPSEGININEDVDEDEEEEDRSNSIEDTMNGNAQSFFPMAGLMAPSYGNMYNWDPSNLSLAQFGSHGSSSSMQQTDQQHQHQHQLQHQLFFCPPLATTSSLFPQHEHLNRYNHLSSNTNFGSVSRDFVPHQQMNSGENNAGRQHQDHKGDSR